MPNSARLLLLDGHQVEALLDPDAAMDAVREAFVLHGRRDGRVFPVVREKLSTGGVFGIKSGDVPTRGLLGFKAAGFWPGNKATGGEPHQATIMLIDPATGRPLCLIDGNAITTARTGAAGALGLTLLARPDSSRICVFGTGVQARIQLGLALRHMPSVRHVRYVTSRHRPDPAFEAIFADACDIGHDADADAAVSDSDIVITATPGRGALFAADAVRPGTHLNCVGADTEGKRELPEDLLPRARLFVDDAGQSRRIGEGQWHPLRDSIEIGALLTGAAHPTRDAGDITIFDMTGLALQDLTVARMLYERASEAGLGTSIPWAW